MPKSLIDEFKSLDRPLRERLADIESPLSLALVALFLARERCALEGLTAEHIVAALEAAGVAVSRLSVARALARAGDRVTRSGQIHGETVYKLMIRGERLAQPLIDAGSLDVLRFDGNKPRSDRARVADLLGKLTGLVRLCDPYYGLRTFDLLENIPATVPVRFMTARTSEAGAKLTNALKDFKRERPKVEFRVAPNPGQIHDRYIIAKDALLLIGHGLKDVGSKESFVIVLDSALVPDLVRDTIPSKGVFLCPGDLRSSFEENLKAGNPGPSTVVRFELSTEPTDRRKMLTLLHRMNINYASLFPGLEGFARSLRQKVWALGVLRPEVPSHR